MTREGPVVASCQPTYVRQTVGVNRRARRRRDEVGVRRETGSLKQSVGGVDDMKASGMFAGKTERENGHALAGPASIGL